MCSYTALVDSGKKNQPKKKMLISLLFNSKILLCSTLGTVPMFELNVGYFICVVIDSIHMIKWLLH